MDNKIINQPENAEVSLDKKRKKLNTPTPEGADDAKDALDMTRIKKPLIITAISLVVIAAIVLTAALIFGNSPIGKLLSKIGNMDNYRMSATVSGIPLFGSLTLEQEVDGNVTHTSAFLFSPEQYKEVVGEETYVYKKSSSDKWTKTKSDGQGNSMNDMIEDLIGDVDNLTNPKNYEKVKGEKNKFRQKDGVEFDGCKDVVITLEDDKITVEMTIDFEGMQLPTTVTIYDIGEVELTLPTVE